jgi:hypothetical protein
MSSTDDNMDTMDASTTPVIKAKSPEYKNLMSPISNSSSEPQTVTKPRRRRKKGNNWTRKKHTLRSPTQTPIVSPTSSPEIKQEEYENHSSSEVKGSGTLWNIHDGKSWKLPTSTDYSVSDRLVYCPSNTSKLIHTQTFAVTTS